MSENTAIASMISISILVGVILGAIVINSTFQRDTYDCTVKCLMVRSIQYNDKCYCEVK